MPNQKIFCNVPWTNAHIYWDGSFGICCSEKHKPYAQDQTSHYNIKKFTVAEWYNQQPIKEFRKNIHEIKPLSNCVKCYSEEQVSYESRRIKENFKSVIFTEQAFEKSYLQSPEYQNFENSKVTGETKKLPVDWHVDLGNECNLACKMCNPQASSKISAHYQSWNLIDTSYNNNWTTDPIAWANFLKSIEETKNLNRIHFMGGEPLLNKNFHTLLDFLIDKSLTHISLSFVTNGTLIDQILINKLKKFKTFNIEVSIESIHSNNHYIRQGVDTSVTLSNIESLLTQTNDQFQLVLRSVPQLLNVNNYNEYIEWAYNKKLSIQGIPLSNPDYLQISVLPIDIRKNILPRYYETLNKLKEQSKGSFATIATGRNISVLHVQLIRECESIINLLKLQEPNNVETLRKELVGWLMKWDKKYNLNALTEYPEYSNFLQQYGYTI